MARKPAAYTNESITSLKGADRVRKRPGVIFGSDGVDGCAHSIFEILSNAIDEAREGYGNRILITKFKDGSVEVEDFGRGMPVDYNKNEQRYNWELLFCEMYAGGKYSAGADNYEYSLGLNGLGLCATQYASEWMTADIYRDGFHYHLDFRKGENTGGLKKEPATRKKTGSAIRWKPDAEVFTDINVPSEYYKDVIKRQAVVNAGVTFVFTDESGEKKEVTEYCYENGIKDYVPGSNELNIENFNISDPNFPRLYSILIGCKPTAEHTPDKSVYSITYSPTESMEMMWTNLETAESEMVMRVITGKDDISAFDRFVERWYAEGGQIITEEVQALYDASQASEQ